MTNTDEELFGLGARYDAVQTPAQARALERAWRGDYAFLEQPASDHDDFGTPRVLRDRWDWNFFAKAFVMGAMFQTFVFGAWMLIRGFDG